MKKVREKSKMKRNDVDRQINRKIKREMQIGTRITTKGKEEKGDIMVITDMTSLASSKTFTQK